MSKLWINPNDMIAHNTMNYSESKKKKRNRYGDYYSYANDEEDIQFCLNCTKPKCTGMCTAFKNRRKDKVKKEKSEEGKK